MAGLVGGDHGDLLRVQYVVQLIDRVVVGVAALSFLDLVGVVARPCELHTPLVCDTSGAVVMNRLGSSVAMPPTHEMSKCFDVFSTAWILAVSV